MIYNITIYRPFLRTSWALFYMNITLLLCHKHYFPNTPHSWFPCTECHKPKIKAKVEEIWPKCYGKIKMPYIKLIVKEFELSIITKKLGKVINWAAFVEETNINQWSKFFKQMEKLKLQRKELKGVKSMQVKCNSHFKGDFAMKVSKSKIIETSCVTKKAPISNDWNVKFGVKVHQML